MKKIKVRIMALALMFAALTVSIVPVFAQDGSRPAAVPHYICWANNIVPPAPGCFYIGTW